MSIRQIALDLYEQEKEISRLKKELDAASPDRQDPIRKLINEASLERDKLRNMLEAKKKG